MQASQADQGQIAMIMDALSELPYKAIWKFDKDVPNIPYNIKLSKWLPQQDILGHPNVKLFITQGGLHSLEEAIANAVPIVGIPFFVDQFFHVQRVTNIGIGKHLDFKTMSKTLFKETVSEVIKNPK